MQTNIQRFPLCIIRVDMSIQHENFCCWQYVFFCFCTYNKVDSSLYYNRFIHILFHVVRYASRSGN